MLNYIKLYILIFLLSFPSLVFSQQKPINVYVIDNDSIPIQKAVITVCKEDSSLLYFSVSDKNGTFQIPEDINKQITSKMFFELSHVEFQNYTSPLHHSFINGQIIKMNKRIVELGDVTVSTKRPIVSFKDGKTIVNVEKLANVENSDISTILKKIPGISITPEGTIQYSGAKATLYIDGRKQILEGKELISYLKSLPANVIKQIEINDIDLSEYNASDEVAIDICTKTKYADGYYLNLGGRGQGYNDKKIDGATYGTYIYKKDRITFNSTLAYRNDYSLIKKVDSTKYMDNSIIVQNRNEKYFSNIVFGLCNLNYITKKGNNFNLNLSEYYDHSNYNYHQPSIEYLTDSLYAFEQSGDGIERDQMWTSNLEFKTRDSIALPFSVSYSFIYGGSNNVGNIFTTNNSQGEKQLFANSKDKMDGFIHEIKSKAEKKINQNSFYLGLSDKYTQLNSNRSYNGIISQDVDKIDYKGEENVFQLYGKSNLKISKTLSLITSLKAENTNYSIDSLNQNHITNNNYWNIFPYVVMGISSNNYQTYFGFTSGISRPNYRWIIPGILYQNEFKYTVGNPDLKPTKRYAIVWNQGYFGFIFLNLRYTSYRDLVGLILQSTQNNTSIYKYRNFGDQQKLNAHLHIPFEFFKENLQGNISSDISCNKYRNIKGDIISMNDPEDIKSNFNLSAEIQYCFANSFSLFSFYSYNSKNESLQYSLKPYYSLDLGLSYKHKNVNMSIECDDIFDSQTKEYTYVTDDYTKNLHNSYNFRCLRLSISFNLKNGEDVREKEKGLIDDIDRFSKD